MPFPKKRIHTIQDIYNLPDGQRGELIDGDLYMMAPPSRIHQKLVHQLDRLIGNYIADKQGSCEVYPAQSAVFLNRDDKNYVEPDISVICDKNKLSDRGCEGAPDWVIEIVSPSSHRMDYQIKLFKYRTAGVREYWVVNPSTKIVMVYGFEEDAHSGQFRFDQTIQSNIYHDFEIIMNDLLK